MRDVVLYLGGLFLIFVCFTTTMNVQIMPILLIIGGGAFGWDGCGIIDSIFDHRHHS